MAKRVRETFARLLEQGSEEEEVRRCICGGELVKETMAGRRKWADVTDPAKWACICDGCNEQQYSLDADGNNVDIHPETGDAITHIWSCARRTPAHFFGFTVCDGCVSNPTRIRNGEPHYYALIS
jgi:hypothetical protein